DDYVMTSHLNLTAETERKREGERERQGDKGTRGQGELFLCLSVPLSPCPLVSFSPCLHFCLSVFIIPPLNQPSPAPEALQGSSPCRSRGVERPAAPRAADGVSICVSSRAGRPPRRRSGRRRSGVRSDRSEFAADACAR